MDIYRHLNRRDFVKLAASAGTAVAAAGKARAQQTIPTRAIPVSGEQLPVIGLGTSDEFERMPADGGEELKAVIATLLDHGGSIIDTAPAYGNAETVVGRLLAEMRNADSVFVSTKIRTRGVDNAIESLQRSHARIGKEVLNVIFIHDIVDVDRQLPNLRSWCDQGRTRYIGISTSELPHFDDMERLVNTEEMDFLQINFGVTDTLAGERVIPAAADRGVAVMINSPFADGGYFGRLRGHDLPDWAAEFDCESWAQFALKYVLATPGVICVIPATSNSGHMIDNARAGLGRLPDAAMRRRMVEHIRSL
jgi:diketogulonate reductase-like aldo/keto reductase